MKLLMMMFGVLLTAPGVVAETTTCYQAFVEAPGPGEANEIQDYCLYTWLEKDLEISVELPLDYDLVNGPDLKFQVLGLSMSNLKSGERFHSLQHQVRGEWRLTHLLQTPIQQSLAVTSLNPPKWEIVERLKAFVNPLAPALIEGGRLLQRRISLRTDWIREGEWVLPAHIFPWEGAAWTMAGVPIAQPGAPLAKYDQAIFNLRGTDPDSRGWELRSHNSGVSWAGHCNGLAAAAVLYPEPEAERIFSEVYFSRDDQKALLTEISYCTHRQFYGRRYNGEGDDPQDINPLLFHQIILGFLSQGSPIVADISQYESVDNRVITAAKIRVREEQADSVTLDAELSISAYSSLPTGSHGPTRTSRKSYSYKIWIDQTGEPVRGEWLTENPDFLWVPTGPRVCGRDNIRVKDSDVQSILGR